jgi:hypothetical protein
MSKYSFFRPCENLIDQGRHRKPVLSATFNRGPDFLTIKTPVIMYCEQRGVQLTWLNPDLKTVFSTEVEVQKKGAFVESIEFENFEAGSENARLIKADSIYAVSCTDSYIHFYRQKNDLFKFHDRLKCNVIQKKLWYLK